MNILSALQREKKKRRNRGKKDARTAYKSFPKILLLIIPGQCVENGNEYIKER